MFASCLFSICVRCDAKKEAVSSAFYDTASLYKSGYQLSDNNFLCGTVAVADDITLRSLPAMAPVS